MAATRSATTARARRRARRTPTCSPSTSSTARSSSATARPARTCSPRSTRQRHRAGRSPARSRGSDPAGGPFSSVTDRERIQVGGELLLGGLAASRDVLDRRVARPIALEELAGDGDLVHLVGAVVDPSGAGGAVHPLERQVGGVAE